MELIETRKFTKGKWEAMSDGTIAVLNRLGEPVDTVASLDIERDVNEVFANARLIAAAPEMFGLICVLLHDDILTDTPRYRALSRARKIVEQVNGTKINWSAPQNDTENLKGGEA